MKSIVLLLWAGLLPLLGVGQASPYSRTAIEQVPMGDLRGDLMGKWASGAPGANQLILVTPDSLPEALQKMQQLVEVRGYHVAERTQTMLTTASKHVDDGVQRYIISRKWFFFHKRQPDPDSDPPVSFRLRVRAFRLPTGTQLQIVGVYIPEGCDECAKGGSEECVGRPMQNHDFEAEARPYNSSPHISFRSMWQDNCFYEARELSKLYRPGKLYLGYVRWYTTTGDRAW